MTGEVRLRFEPGACTVVGRRSDHSLYDLSLATYGSGDAFDQSDARATCACTGCRSRCGRRSRGRGDVTDGRAAVGGPLLDAARPRGARARPLARTSTCAWPRTTSTRRSRTSARCADAGLLDADEAAALGGGARGRRRRRSPRDGSTFDDADEDIHSAIERGVTERLGDLGAKLHAGRSRNDLVVTDLRLWLLAAGRRIESGIALAGAHARRRGPREHAATVMPGTTHARFAQPVTLGHHLLAHAWAFSATSSARRSGRSRASVSALGAGATATSTLGLDSATDARALGMHRAFANSIDAVSDRDFVQEFLAVATITATHLSRLAADLARWSDPALGWAELDEAYSTGSSMMPQKRNPDTAELARSEGGPRRRRLRCAHVDAAGPARSGTTATSRRTRSRRSTRPTRSSSCSLRWTGAIATIRFDPEAMRAACADEGLYATDLAEALVRDGVPFRRPTVVPGSC